MIKFNKKKFFIIFSAFVLFFCILTSTVFTSAKDKMIFQSSENSNYTFINNNLMLADFKDNQVSISGVSNTDINYTYSLDRKIHGIKCSDTGFCVYNLETSNKEKVYCFEVYKYNGNLVFSKKLSFPSQPETENYSINYSLDDDLNLYISLDSNSNKILKTCKSDFLNKTFSLNTKINQLIYFNEKTYAIGDSKVYVLENDELKTVNTSDRIIAPAVITGKNTLTDNKGKVFEFENNSFNLIADFNKDNSLCVKTDKYFLTFSDNKAYGNEINNPDKYVEYTFDFYVTNAYYVDSYIYVCGFKNGNSIVEKLQDNEIKSEQTDTTEPTLTPTDSPTTKPAPSLKPTTATEPTNNTEPTSNTEPTKPIKETEPTISPTLTQPSTDKNENTFINSSKDYKINQNVISNVKNNTSVSEFKNSFNFEGDILILSKNNVIKTSGAIGTGMKAVFSNDNIKQEYLLCVSGDLTGEGNVNSLDVNKMFEFLLDKSTPTAIEFTAGDLNQDNVLTNKDLLLLERLTKEIQPTKANSHSN